MPIADGQEPTIKLTFLGLVITRVKDGAAKAEVGVLRGVETHQLRTITSTKNGNPFSFAGPLNLSENFSLDVQNSSLTNIKVFTTPEFNRLNDAGDPLDFRWWIDMEKDLFTGGGPVAINFDALGPIIDITCAEFYTEARSENRLQLKRAGGATEPFGKIAIAIGANIYLDQPGSRAVLMNGDREILNVSIDDGDTYVIEFDCECERGPDDKESDFPLVFRAFPSILPADQIDLVSEEDESGPIVGGDARCGGSNGG
jgi:hypothetical protein